MISPNRVKFQKIFSNELNIPDLIMECAFESDNSEVSTYLNREAVSVESYDGRHNNAIRYKYSERFSPRFTFMKKGFGDFDSSELRAVFKWLTSSDVPTLLDVYYDDSNVVGFSAVGNWTEISSYKLANNRTVAVVATFEAVHPFALSDLYTVTKTISDPEDNKIVINIDTDDNKPIYPRITIQHNGSIVKIPTTTNYSSVIDMNLDGKVENTMYFNGSKYYLMSEEVISSATQPDYDWEIIEVEGSYAGKETIKNNKIYYYTNTNTYYWIDPYYFHEYQADDPKRPILATTSVKFVNTHTDLFNRTTVIDSTVVKNNNPNEVVTLDGANKVVSSNSVNRIFDDDFVDWSWLPLLDGKNEITVEGNCTVTISYREPRKIGEY